MTAVDAVGESSAAGQAQSEPVTEQPTTGQPTTEQPTTGQLATEQPSGERQPGAERKGRAVHPSPLPLWAGVILALASGAAQLLAFPPYGLWWLAPVGTALLAIAAHRRRLRAGAGLGALAGLTFFVPLLSWTEIVGGVAPWLILAVSQSAFLALLGAGTAWLSPLADRYRWVWPLATGVFWVGQEALRDRIPFGGFPWGRLAFSQGDSPLLRFASVGGAPLVTFAVALAGGLLVVAVWRPWRSGTPRVRLMGAAAGLGAVLVVVVGLAVPLAHPSGRAVNVAVIQGNVPRLGLEFNAQRRAVLDNHVAATRQLAQQVAAGKAPQPDLVVWPENSSDIDPLIPQDADARSLIDGAAAEIKAPILVGTLLEGPGENLRNVGIVWQPGTGPTTPYYVKQHPVPFAEYMPLRGLAQLVSSRAALVGNFVPGDHSGVLDTGKLTVGDVICFEIGYDDLVRSAVQGGGQLVTVQTNNADFSTAEARQQLAMVQLRAVEHGRDALMASTVGVSAFVTSDGTVLDATRFNTQAELDRALRLGDEQTLATRLGPLPEFVLGGIAVLVLVGAGAVRVRDRRIASA
ncbi:apolipoprotein N-acyltransferase [Rugosimonospora africana]|uniref:Apolipoprotein N-acyltransferase n=1 Tax=Rugosimonospora africana TaxID=556532 RepID=A0A8J3QPB5_9ACTN|nr:apolipoprotein N-acyltransferase [Rugosimonospora africana]GIH13924.1 apolipoprotein N-acyltransferase [Rugosimonospora africana]